MAPQHMLHLSKAVRTDAWSFTRADQQNRHIAMAGLETGADGFAEQLHGVRGSTGRKTILF